MKLLILFQTSTVAPLKFGNGYVISPHTTLYHGCIYLSMLGLNLTHVSKRCPRIVFTIKLLAFLGLKPIYPGQTRSITWFLMCSFRRQASCHYVIHSVVWTGHWLLGGRVPTTYVFTCVKMYIYVLFWIKKISTTRVNTLTEIIGRPKISSYNSAALSSVPHDKCCVAKRQNDIFQCGRWWKIW